MNAVMVFIGGGLGSLARFALSRYNNVEQINHLSVVGTFSANMISCFILGLVLGYHYKSPIDSTHLLLLVTGFCGGFSTFSTFSYELLTFIEKDQFIQAALYFTISILVSILLIVIGFKVYNMK